MSRYLLDTNIVSEAIKIKPSPHVLSRLDKHGDQCAIGAPTWQELLLGVYRMPQGSRRDAIERYYLDIVRTSFPIIEYDQRAAEWHAKELARLMSLGRPTPLIDSQIASIACTNELIVVTRNIKDFNLYNTIEIENWFETH